MENNSDQEWKGDNVLETLINTLDQNMIKTNEYICLSFELIVLKK